MAVIHAKGDTEYGRLEIRITGSRAVERLEAGDPAIEEFFMERIHAGAGWMANAYHPKPDTMLQAYAFCTNIFKPEEVTVDGDIGTMPYEEGVEY